MPTTSHATPTKHIMPPLESKLQTAVTHFKAIYDGETHTAGQRRAAGKISTALETLLPMFTNRGITFLNSLIIIGTIEEAVRRGNIFGPADQQVLAALDEEDAE